MATEDFTTFTEVDEADDITKTASRITVDNMEASVSSYVYKDYGAGHFGDFEHLITYNVTSQSDLGSHGIWSCHTDYGDYTMLDYEKGMMLNVYDDSIRIQLYNCNNVTKDEYTAGTGTFYLTIKRNGSTGTCKIYSDAERTNLLDTLTLTVDTDTFQYVQGMLSRNSGSGRYSTYYTENLDLQEAAAPQTISPTGITTAEALGTAQLNLKLEPSGIASGEAFGTARLNLQIVASGIASAEAFGSPTVTGGAITLYPTGIASQEAFGTAILAGPIIVIGIPSAEAFGTIRIRRALAHPILEATYAYHTKPTNRAQVFGDGVLTEDWDWDEIEMVYDQLSQANDINLDTTTKAHQRGQAILRDAHLEAIAGHILIPMNCGQDLYDVIAITSPQVGLNGSRFRVLALTHTWTPSKGKYTLKIGLGAP